MRNFRSIYYKNFITMAGILLISFMFLGVAFALFSYRFLMEEKRDAMVSNVHEVVRIVSVYDGDAGMTGLEVRMVLTGLENTTGYHIAVCDLSGEIVSCSEGDVQNDVLGRQVSQQIMQLISANDELSGVSDLGGVFPSARYVVTCPIVPYPGAPVSGYVLMSSDLAAMSAIWRQFSRIYIVTALIVVLIAFAITLYTSKRQTRSIDEMAQAAHRFARGDFSTRVACPDSPDEIGELAIAFNAMAESLEKSEKTRRELIANVSHELKTPMTTITGFADGILDGTVPPEKHDEYLRAISSETRRLSRLVRNMLDMSRIQALDAGAVRQKKFDITEVVRIAVLSLEKKITDKGLDVDLELPEESVVTCGDQDSITQVAYNLIDNAIKFSNSGSVIKIEVWKQGGKAYVSVENTGETISKEELPLIFDRFHKTDRSRSMDKDGVGLGLYIVKTILDSHNEDIFVTSSDGVTRFVFTMTLA